MCNEEESGPPKKRRCSKGKEKAREDEELKGNVQLWYSWTELNVRLASSMT
jgi:hypothetical protein